MSEKLKKIRNTIIGGISINEHTNYHKKLKRRFGSASKCEMPDCKSIKPKRFEWALRKGHKYSANPNDYIQLCPSCHRKYDFTEEIRCKLKAKKEGESNNRAKLKNIDVIEIVNLINGGYENKFIANKFNVHPTIISNIKTGKRWGALTGIKKQ